MTDITDALATLHTRLMDACKGYEEGRELATEPRIVALFDDLLAMHRTHAAEIRDALIARGVEPDEGGSFLQYVHKAILTVRSAVTGLDENVLPGLRDGEGRLVELYDETRLGVAADPDLDRLLERQRDIVSRRVLRLEALERTAEA